MGFSSAFGQRRKVSESVVPFFSVDREVKHGSIYLMSLDARNCAPCFSGYVDCMNLAFARSLYLTDQGDRPAKETV